MIFRGARSSVRNARDKQVQRRAFPLQQYVGCASVCFPVFLGIFLWLQHLRDRRQLTIAAFSCRYLLLSQKYEMLQDQHPTSTVRDVDNNRRAEDKGMGGAHEIWSTFLGFAYLGLCFAWIGPLYASFFMADQKMVRAEKKMYIVRRRFIMGTY